ncbi:MAG TPA: TonB-dependent receptor [Thermoanaerobaculia bacterium]|nr:TonB-dependent receptor [Thermoanaerobaculia bacterium]
MISLLAFSVQGQVTSGNIGGTVTGADGAALPGVTVEAVHVPTGTRYSTVSASDGRYTIPNVRVGGPYRVTANLEGFKPRVAEGVQVSLGETREVPITLSLATVTESITVTAQTDPIMNPEHNGSTSSVSTRQIETLPTVNRTLQDFARTNPYFTTDLSDANGTTLNVAGRNNRYNNIQIDGAVNNDLFGLAGTGTPGGQTGAQPISLDAIQQLQLVVSPYDVRQSGFTGGGVNAVTRNGTNTLEGSVFGTKRNRSYVGKGINDTPVSEFNQTGWGGRIGGPIVRDKIFFFIAGEENRKDTPLGITGATYTGSGTGSRPGLQDVEDFVKSKYNIDLGGTGDISSKVNNNLLFGRFDFNLGSQNNLTLRHNYVYGTTPVAPSSYSRTANQFYFPTSRYNIGDHTYSDVAQLNSVFSSSVFNEARYVHQSIKDARTTPVLFPTVEIGGTGQRAGAVQIGTERFSGANTLDQKINEFTDDVTLVHGSHNIVIGTHNELFQFTNLFIQDFYGYYYFPTLAAFEAGQPTAYSIGFANNANPRNPTQFKASQYSLYANDQWHVNKSLTLSFGLRADKPSFPDTPAFNPLVQSELGLLTTSKPKDTVTWEPRLGFNWDPNNSGTQQIRGGVGVFQGRAPYVWISNGYGGSGIDQVILTCTAPACTTPFNPDPNAQPRTFPPGSAAPQISITDPNFKFPRVLRTTLGYDRELFWGVRATAEALYSKTLDDIFYYNMNLVQNGTSPLDGRPTYAKRSSKLAGTYLVSNSTTGHETNETLQLSKTVRGLTLSANYMHQNAVSAADATSSTAASGWNFQPNNGNDFTQQLAPTFFQVKHRVNLAATYDTHTGAFTHSFGVFYAAQSGNPYSLLISGDPNTDANQNNDLLYVPGGGSGGVILCPFAAGSALPKAGAPCGTSTPLDSANFTNFLHSVGVNGNNAALVGRNSLQAPWQHRMDLHYELGLPAIHSARILIQADVVNFLNLINKNWGIEKFVNFSTYTPVRYQGIDPTSGKPVYRENNPGSLTAGSQFSGDTSLASRWQGRLGLRINF